MARANLRRLEEGKLYYSISEVCAMTGLEQHVLRYWESEFPQLRPKKNRSGNRAYRNKEIKIIRYIKYLLYDELYTIPGAKKKMADANLADLEGQMTLIRMPAAPARAREPVPAAPSAGEGPEGEGSDGEGESSVYGGAEPSGRGEAPDPGEREAGGPEPGAPPAYLEDAPGPEAAAAEERLRGELLRLRDELKRLLVHLQTGNRAGYAASGNPPASMAAAASEADGVPERAP